MKVLLDTSTFLWLAFRDARLSRAVVDALDDTENERLLSSVSAWEIAIKHAAGKLPIPDTSVDNFVARLREANQIDSLPLDEAAALAVTRLPPIHRDPFDRVLIAQAIHHGLVFATSDVNIRRYPVRTLW